MSVVMDILNNFFALNFSWFIDFTLNNILWLFLFAALAAILYSDKNWFWATIFLTIYTLAYLDFTVLVSWVVLDKSYLMVALLSSIAVWAIAEYDSWGSKHLLLIDVTRGIVLLSTFNLFFM